MNPELRTKEWLAQARRLAGISQAELAGLIGSKGVVTVSQYETGACNPSERAWRRIEDALRPLAPMAFVDTDALIAKAQAIIQWESEESPCVLTYAGGRGGLIITGIDPPKGEAPEGLSMPVRLADALSLLREQKAGLERPLRAAADPDAQESAGKRLRAQREALGLGQRAVAEMLSVTQPYVSALESGRMDDSEPLARYRQLLEELAAKGAEG